MNEQERQGGATTLSGLRPAVWQKRVVVEVASRRNQNYQFFNGKLLRGRWAKENIPGSIDDDRFRGMPDLPGLHILIDPEKRRAVVFDPLGDQQYERLRKKAEASVLATFGVQCGPEKKTVYSDLTEDDLKTWFYWTMRMVWSKNGEVKSGTMPTLDQIREMPGKVRFHNYTSNAEQERYTEIPRRQAMPDIPDHPEDLLVDPVAEYESSDAVLGE